SIVVRVNAGPITGTLTRCHTTYCSTYVFSAEIPSTGTITFIPRIAAPLAVYSTAPCAAVPTTITVLVPLSLRIFSRSVPENLSTPDDITGSFAAGARSLAMSAGLLSTLTLNTTGTPAVRAAVNNALTFGIDAMQRGLRCGLQVCSLKSSISSAVVLLSIMTAFKGGGGGAVTELH